MRSETKYIPEVMLTEICRWTEQLTGIDAETIRGQNRGRQTARCRWAIWTALRNLKASYPQIGAAWSRNGTNRADHTTVRSGVNAMAEQPRSALFATVLVDAERIARGHLATLHPNMRWQKVGIADADRHDRTFLSEKAVERTKRENWLKQGGVIDTPYLPEDLVADAVQIAADIGRMTPDDVLAAGRYDNKFRDVRDGLIMAFHGLGANNAQIEWAVLGNMPATPATASTIKRASDQRAQIVYKVQSAVSEFVRDELWQRFPGGIWEDVGISDATLTINALVVPEEDDACDQGASYTGQRYTRAGNLVFARPEGLSRRARLQHEWAEAKARQAAVAEMSDAFYGGERDFGENWDAVV